MAGCFASFAKPVAWTCCGKAQHGVVGYLHWEFMAVSQHIKLQQPLAFDSFVEIGLVGIEPLRPSGCTSHMCIQSIV